jgi:acetoacetate decarboxylase
MAHRTRTANASWHTPPDFAPETAMRTRFVKTPEQLAAYRAAMEHGDFEDNLALGIAFETDPDVIAELLPPPLRPTDKPRVTVSIAQTRRSNCVGPFDGGNVNLFCEYGGVQGTYCLAMPMSTDTALVYGRELYGEPKKLAHVSFEREGNRVRASVTRHGIAFMELEGVFEDEPRGPRQESTGAVYHFRYTLDPAGGITRPVDLVRVTVRRVTDVMVRGTGIVRFRESPHDPVIDIPVHTVLSAVYSEGANYTRAEVVATVPGEDFLPYAFAKTDCYPMWLPEPAAVRATG